MELADRVATAAGVGASAELLTASQRCAVDPSQPGEVVAEAPARPSCCRRGTGRPGPSNPLRYAGESRPPGCSPPPKCQLGTGMRTAPIASAHTKNPVIAGSTGTARTKGLGCGRGARGNVALATMVIKLLVWGGDRVLGVAPDEFGPPPQPPSAEPAGVSRPRRAAQVGCRTRSSPASPSYASLGPPPRKSGSMNPTIRRDDPAASFPPAARRVSRS